MNDELLYPLLIEVMAKEQFFQAEGIARYFIIKEKHETLAIDCLQRIAQFFGRTNHRVVFEEKLHLSSPALENKLEKKQDHIYGSTSRTVETARKYLLIKPWGCGLGSDILHVLEQLYFAEKLNRVPIIDWSRESLYSSPSIKNAFHSFFEPITDLAISDIINDKTSVYPDYWNYKSLTQQYFPVQQKLKREDKHNSSMYFFDKSDDVVVSDFNNYFHSLWFWGEELERFSVDKMYNSTKIINTLRSVVCKYLVVKNEIKEEAEQFFIRNGLDKEYVIAIHVRGSDKISEQPSLARNSYEQVQQLKRVLCDHAGAKIFLLTDDNNILSYFKKEFGENLYFTDCHRTSSSIGIHYGPRSHLEGPLWGKQMLVDILIAIKCSYFIGNSSSNVAAIIFCFKKWAEGSFTFAHNISVFSHFQIKLPTIFTGLAL